jgi:hypothetical protein
MYLIFCPAFLPNERCLEPDVPLNDEINPETDTDSFSIYHTGSGETLVRINISEEEASLALCLDVWSPSRIHVRDTDCYATSFIRDVLLTEEGEYGVAISDSGLNGIGSYTVEIQCLSGNCPLSCTDEDTDVDGILDNQDNCPNHPNGPALGTCTSGPYELIGIQTCTSNEECDSNGFCSMNQEDIYPPGGNGIGDACECESDFNCDGNVDASDVEKFLEDFGRSQFNNPCPACAG